jgi:hypothetical protein
MEKTDRLRLSYCAHTKDFFLNCRVIGRVPQWSFIVEKGSMRQVLTNSQYSVRPYFSTRQTGPIWPNVATLMLQLCTRMQHQCCDIEHV